MSLPFFDEPQPARDFPVLDAAPAAHEVVVSQDVSDAPMDARLAADEQARLETLLGELTGLKARLRIARERTN
jgi:hypothetical protein